MNVIRALVTVTVFATPLAAQTPAGNGVTYLDTVWHGRQFQVARVDLNRTQLRMYWKNEHGQEIGSVRGLQTWLAGKGETLLAGMNAGMFNKCSPVPTGLYIEHGRNPGSPLSTLRRPPHCEVMGNFYEHPNGVFYIARDGTAHIVARDQARTRLSNMVEATQSGPHLLNSGTFHTLRGKPGIPRNAIAVCSPTEVALVLAPEGARIRELGEFIRDYLHCQDALYLDGGPVPALLVPGRVEANVRARAVAMIGVTPRSTTAAGANPRP
ncbi:MAG TPA: phosphodiester glycosidase family protein [Longimicrobium sp.]|nr:phosphodiester glycosidase family protein [Longimicrobium sp.]